MWPLHLSMSGSEGSECSSEGSESQRRLDIWLESTDDTWAEHFSKTCVQTSLFAARPLLLWAFQSSKFQLQAAFGQRRSLPHVTAAQSCAFNSLFCAKQRQSLLIRSRISATLAARFMVFQGKYAVWHPLKQSTCVLSRRHELRIAHALQHDVVDGTIQWSEPLALRLSALYALEHVPGEQTLAPSHVHALSWSLADAEQEVVIAATRAISRWAEWLCYSPELKEPGFLALLCDRFSVSLASASSEDAKTAIAWAIGDLAYNTPWELRGEYEDACRAAVDALRSPVSDGTKAAMSCLL